MTALFRIWHIFIHLYTDARFRPSLEHCIGSRVKPHIRRSLYRHSLFMPRSRGRSSAPAPRQQTRSAHTMAPPAQHAPQQHVPQQQVGQRQPGLFGQMASTAAGVAVGSAVGHTLANGVSSLFGGSSAPAEQAAPVQAASSPDSMQQNGLQQSSSGQCEFDARNLTQCLDQNSGDMRVCQWYLDNLKSCLSASSNY